MSSPYRSAQEAPREPRVALRWISREPPLAPEALAVLGAAACLALLRRLASQPASTLARLRGVGSTRALVVQGPSDALPWIDGAHWLGRDPTAPALFLPTALRPQFGAALLERALLRDAELIAPLAVFPRGGEENACTVISLVEALPISPSRLAALLAEFE